MDFWNEVPAILFDKNLIPFANKNFISEGIIFPLNIKINSLDMNELNLDKNLLELNIKFFNDELRFYDAKNKEIHIGLIGIKTKSELSEIIGHEIIHSVQDIRSSGKYENYKKILISYFEDIIPNMKLFHQKVMLKKIQDILLFNNPYEKMAYAYLLVQSHKKIINKDIHDLLDKIKIMYPDLEQDKRFKKYVYLYYENIKEN